MDFILNTEFADIHPGDDHMDEDLPPLLIHPHEPAQQHDHMDVQPVASPQQG